MMILLIEKNCPHCDKIKEMAEKYPEIKMFYVNNGFVEIENNKTPLDSRIPALPALIHEKTVYVGTNYIKDFLENLNNKIGE